MCGRFALGRNRNEIRQLPGYDLDVQDWENEDNFVPRYNIAPRTQVPVVRRRDDGPNDEPDLIIQTMKWGLVPHWSKHENTSLSTTNARADKLVEGGGMWGSLRATKRCVIPCTGYYEWLTKGKQKIPHYTKRQDDNIMLLAGLYDSAQIQGRTIWTFTIVTTDANKDFSWLHDRQPVILSSTKSVSQWLDTSSSQWNKDLTSLVNPYHDSLVPLVCYQVPQEVGKVGTESPTFIEPITLRKDGIQAMFSKQAKKETSTSSPVKPEALSTNLPSVKQKEEKVSIRKRSHSPTLADEEMPTKKFKKEDSPRKSPKKKPQTPSGHKPITSFFTTKS